MTIRVLQVGLGPIGVAVARQLVDRRGYELVGGIDLDPAKVGRDLGEACGLAEALGIVVRDDLEEALEELRPMAAVLCTSSSLERMAPTVDRVLERVSVAMPELETAADHVAEIAHEPAPEDAGEHGE